MINQVESLEQTSATKWHPQHKQHQRTLQHCCTHCCFASLQYHLTNVTASLGLLARACTARRLSPKPGCRYTDPPSSKPSSLKPRPTRKCQITVPACTAAKSNVKRPDRLRLSRFVQRPPARTYMLGTDHQASYCSILLSSRPCDTTTLIRAVTQCHPRVSRSASVFPNLLGTPPID